MPPPLCHHAHRHAAVCTACALPVDRQCVHRQCTGSAQAGSSAQPVHMQAAVCMQAVHRQQFTCSAQAAVHMQCTGSSAHAGSSAQAVHMQAVQAVHRQCTCRQQCAGSAHAGSTGSAQAVHMQAAVRRQCTCRQQCAARQCTGSSSHAVHRQCTGRDMACIFWIACAPLAHSDS